MPCSSVARFSTRLCKFLSKEGTSRSANPPRKPASTMHFQLSASHPHRPARLFHRFSLSDDRDRVWPQGRPDEALAWFEKARGTIAAVPELWANLAAARALRGDLAEAAADLAEARRLSLDDRYSSIARLRAAGLPRAPKVRELIEAIYFDGLRKAGMPEE